MTESGRFRRMRRLVLAGSIVAALLLLVQRGDLLYTGGWGTVGSYDFVEYWSAAKLLVRGDNPYDPASALEMAQLIGWPYAEPQRMWNPPWTLALLLPLAPLPFGAASLVWLAIQLLLLLGSGVLLWRYYAPDDGRHWIGLLLAAGYVPGLFALAMGQISPWLLAGVVGFLVAERSRRDLVAGGALALLMIKPHYAYLFWLAALWWAWRTRRWRILGGWLAGLLLTSLAAVLFRADLFAGYLGALAEPPVNLWATPVVGTWLRVLFGWDWVWLQYLPSLLGLLGLAVWLLRQRGPWRWRQLAAPLLLVSACTTAYGWPYDQVVLLVVVADLVSRVRFANRARLLAVLGTLALFQLALVVQRFLEMNGLLYIWFPLALTGLYGWTVWSGHSRQDRVVSGGVR